MKSGKILLSQYIYKKLDIIAFTAWKTKVPLLYRIFNHWEEYESRYTLLWFTVLYRCWFFFFPHKLKVCGNPVLSKYYQTRLDCLMHSKANAEMLRLATERAESLFMRQPSQEMGGQVSILPLQSWRNIYGIKLRCGECGERWLKIGKR